MLTRLKIRRVLTALCLLLVGHLLPISAQEVIGKLDLDRITAGGDPVPLPVHFDPAPAYNGYAIVTFSYKLKPGEVLPPNKTDNFQCRGDAKAGVTDIALSCDISMDNVGGQYYPSDLVRLQPPPHATVERTEKYSGASVLVIAVQDTNVYPNSVVGTISLNQERILESGASKVETLLDELNTKVDNNSAETPELKIFIASIATAAQKQLEKDRAAYVKLLPKGTQEPIFFQDFDRLYSKFLYEIEPPPSARAHNGSQLAAHFQTVQMTTSQTITVTPSQLDNSLGPYVKELSELLGNHRLAFQKIAKSGSTNFYLDLHSDPPGASVSYKRQGDEYQDYSKPTDVDKAMFPYALWTFRFTLGNCVVVKPINPYIEQSPNLNPPMPHCIKK